MGKFHKATPKPNGKTNNKRHNDKNGRDCSGKNYLMNKL